MGSSDRMLNLIQFEKCFSFKKSEENMTSLWRHSGSHAIGSEFDSSKCYFFFPLIYLFIYFIYFSFFLILTLIMIMATVLLIKT